MKTSQLVTFCGSTLFLLLELTIANNKVKCVNILGLMGTTSPSHHIWNSALLHALAQRGHNLTILSVDLPKPHEKVPANVHYIYLEKGYEMYNTENKDIQVDITQYIGMSAFELISMAYDFNLRTCRGIAVSDGLQTLLNYPDDFRFDLVINDYTLGPFLLGFAHKFNYPPIMGISAFHNPPITIDSMSNHYFPAYTPFYSTTYGVQMDFWQRLTNTLIFVADTLYRRIYYLPEIDAIMRPYFPNDMPFLGDISKRTLISLVNSHPAINYATSVPPNVIEVGGMHLQNPSPLADELDWFMRNGTRGSILFSLGTNMKSQDTSFDKVRIILNAMTNVPEYNFIWKFDEEYLRGLRSLIPKNVLIKSFLPQVDILGHPNIKAFVTHCGGLSSQEATWFGVPMIGMPLFLDQHQNLQQSMLAGVAHKIDYITLTEDSLSEAMRRVAENSEMSKKAKERSIRFRDRPHKPLEAAIWWVEYLLREPNPSHLKSPASNLTFFAANSLDVFLVLMFVPIMLCFSLYHCSGRRNKKKPTSYRKKHN